jgi:hypothetical protein
MGEGSRFTPNEALLSSLFGTPEDLKQQTERLVEQSMRERDEILSQSTFDSNSHTFHIEDDWGDEEFLIR